jgi:hypothetical protein
LIYFLGVLKCWLGKSSFLFKWEVGGFPNIREELVGSHFLRELLWLKSWFKYPLDYAFRAFKEIQLLNGIPMGFASS